MKIVLDTNIVLISVPRFSKYRPIFDALLADKLVLAISNDILSEYQEIIARKTNPTIANNLAELLVNLPNVEFVDTYFRWHLILADADDNKFVDCAIAANVDFIVTNDRHFQELQGVQFPQLSVVNADELLALLQEE
ncbi:MAG: putative toxin-antitoxin system toxin component, PIN family [Pyrinomonadaceae bacterium]|nr:putative toxin-antitoxin system toxin component, PIN family [Pyrinomonadaceae bacterium]